MKNQLRKPIPYALVIASLFSQNAAAQATASVQQVPSVQSLTGDTHSTMDHAAMGHVTPPSSPAKPVLQPAVPAKPDARQSSGQAAHSVPTEAKTSRAEQQNQQQGQGSEHTGHHTTAPANRSGTPTAPEPGNVGQPVREQSPASGHAGHAMPAQASPTVQGQRNAPQAQNMDHSAMGHAPPPGASASNAHAGMDHAAQAIVSPAAGGQDMQMGRMQGGPPPADARDPNAYNEGTKFAHLGNHEMNDNAPFWKDLYDKAEAAKGDGEQGQNVEFEAWYGNDYDKAWVKAEGERRGEALESARTELLWDRAFATFWSTQVGVRHDSGEGKSRNWLAFGVQGLAPYWFETEATAYWRPGSGLAARLSVKYEVLFTSRLILEPEVEANLYSRSDPEREIGSGLSDISAGLRLRYEVTRQFAPYIGVTWSRQFGETADFTRIRGRGQSEVQAVAGIRVWF